MALDRTWWNNLVDDDGSGNVGTIWNKNTIKGLLDAIDAMFVQSVAFTPILKFGGNNVGWTQAQIGQYSRADDIIVCEFQLTVTAKGTSVGIATITGLPFQPKLNMAPVIVFQNLASFVGLTGIVGGTIGSGTTSITLAQVTPAGVSTQLNDTNFGNGSNMSCSAIYRKL